MKVIVYHQVKQGVDCPDGIMSASIAQLANPDFELIGDWYNSDGPDFGGDRVLEFGDEVIIVDFSYSAERLLRWEQWGVKVTLIDHHAPKFPDLEGFSGAILDADECGATLAWKHFFPDKPMPEILKHVRRRDIGADGYYKAAENCIESKQITTALSKGRSMASDKIAYLQKWLTASTDALEYLREHGEALQSADAERANAIAQTGTQTTLPVPSHAVFNTVRKSLKTELDRLALDDVITELMSGVDCWKVVIEDPKSDRLYSSVGAAVCQREGQGTICWIITTDGQNHLRSNGVNIEPYAKALGGGGHIFASGFGPLASEGSAQ